MSSQLSPFSQWALDDARTPDERYLIYLVCEACRLVQHQRKPYEQQCKEFFQHPPWHQWEEFFLNPLLMPSFREQETELAAAMSPWLKKFIVGPEYRRRRIGDAGGVFRFFPALEILELGSTALKDLSFLTALPNLRKFQILSPYLEDLEPLSECEALRDLTLHLSAYGCPIFEPPLHWVDARPLGKLQQLEVLNLLPNAAILQGLSFPSLHSAVLDCAACVQWNCEFLPDMPALHLLTLTGVQSLQGISRFSQLRHLQVSGPLREFGDLASLAHLDCFSLETTTSWPQDVTPVSALPSLLWVRFLGAMPRNYWPLTQAPKLCELAVEGAPVVQLDVQAINAALRSWDEIFLAAEPQPLPPLRFLAAEPGLDLRGFLPPYPEEPIPVCRLHPKRFQLEIRWMHQRINEAVKRRLGDRAIDYAPHSYEHTWDYVSGVEIQTLEAVNRLPELIQILRETIACSPHPWKISIVSHLRLTEMEMSEQQKRWLQQIDQPHYDRMDAEEHERWKLRQAHLIETEFRLRSSQEDGEAPDPADFIPPEELTNSIYREPAYARTTGTDDDTNTEDDDAEDDTPEDNPDFALKPFDEQEQNPPGDNDNDDDNSVATAPPLDPPPGFLDDPYAHPLADSYAFIATLTLDTFYQYGSNLATVMQLLGREPDVFHTAPKREES